MEKVAIHIVIRRDEKNEPFAKVFYSGIDANNVFNIQGELKNAVGYLARKAVTGLNEEGVVYVSTETGEVLENGQFDKLHDMNYCIAGSLSGVDNVMNLIDTIRAGATNKDVNLSVAVSDGYCDPIFIDDQNDNYEKLDELLKGPSESHKMG